MEKIILARSLPAIQPFAVFIDNKNGDVRNGVQDLLGYFQYFVVGACVVGVFIVAFKMVASYRSGELDESFGRLAAVGVACILTGTAASITKVVIAGLFPDCNGGGYSC